MPCWFYEKKDLRNTASYQDGISAEVEARYRREGARFILDAGTKMGLRYDTCATGVTYFHRFYMFHSFREFHRYITGACCLFLAGKVEETPKKCKDIIKISQSLLTPQQFSVFGDDPKEEVMTLERILLQTIKFDLRVEHPYSYLLKFAKILKGDKHKVQKMVQMTWTFINDHLCTTLCLQWEPEIIAVSLMYLASRLSKYDIQDWEGKPTGCKLKWWEFFVEDINMELMEDICHQVLDLYSTSSQKREESPPMTPNRAPVQQQTKSPQQLTAKRTRTNSPTPDQNPNHGRPRPDSTSATETPTSGEPAPKRPTLPPQLTNTSSKSSPVITTTAVAHSRTPATAPVMSQAVIHPTVQSAPTAGQTAPPTQLPGGVAEYSNGDGYSQYNPYMSSQMYSSSFMSQEGTQSIQSLISQSRGSQYPLTSGGQYSQPPPPAGAYPQTAYPQQSSYPPPPTGQPFPPSYQYSAASYPPQQNAPYQTPTYPPPTQATYQQYGSQYTNQNYSNQNPPQYNPSHGASYQQRYPNPGTPQFGTASGPPPRPPVSQQQQQQASNPNPGLATVRITGRQPRR